MKILLATDGSPCSDVAVEEVARRPWPEDSQVRIVSVVEPHAPLTAEPWLDSAAYFKELEAAERDKAQVALGKAATLIQEGEGGKRLAVNTEMLMGSPRRVIVEEAEKWGADLIVLGSHGYRSWERLLLGSVSQAVALHAGCSVEIVGSRVAH